MVLRKYNNELAAYTALFPLLHYFVASHFRPCRSSSGRTDAASEAELYVILQLKIHEIFLPVVHKFQVNFKILTRVVNI